MGLPGGAGPARRRHRHRQPRDPRRRHRRAGRAGARRPRRRRGPRRVLRPRRRPAGPGRVAGDAQAPQPDDVPPVPAQGPAGRPAGLVAVVLAGPGPARRARPVDGRPAPRAGAPGHRAAERRAPGHPVAALLRGVRLRPGLGPRGRGPGQLLAGHRRVRPGARAQPAADQGRPGLRVVPRHRPRDRRPRHPGPARGQAPGDDSTAGAGLGRGSRRGVDRLGPAVRDPRRRRPRRPAPGVLLRALGQGRPSTPPRAGRRRPRRPGRGDHGDRGASRPRAEARRRLGRAARRLRGQ